MDDWTASQYNGNWHFYTLQLVLLSLQMTLKNNWRGWQDMNYLHSKWENIQKRLVWASAGCVAHWGQSEGLDCGLPTTTPCWSSIFWKDSPQQLPIGVSMHSPLCRLLLCFCHPRGCRHAVVTSLWYTCSRLPWSPLEAGASLFDIWRRQKNGGK